MSKARVPILCAIVAATYWMLEPILDVARDGMVKTFATDLVVALLAVITLIAIGGVMKREVVKAPQHFYSLVTVVAFAVTLAIGLACGPSSAAFVWIFDYVYAPLESTLLALVAFALVNAALKSMRSRSVEASVLIASAAIVMLGRAPPTTGVGTVLTPVADWLTRVPNVAGQRVLLIGAALAAGSTLLRLMLGLERDYLGERR